MLARPPQIPDEKLASIEEKNKNSSLNVVAMGLALAIVLPRRWQSLFLAAIVRGRHGLAPHMMPAPRNPGEP